jgi:hypothetical protein
MSSLISPRTAATRRHRARHSRARLAVVKALRCTPIPLRGADGLDDGCGDPASRDYVMALDTALRSFASSPSWAVQR